jgi:hypothetical protein
VPLKVEFHAVSPDARIACVLRGATERSDEPKLFIESDRGDHIARHQNGVDSVKMRSHHSLSPR